MKDHGFDVASDHISMQHVRDKIVGDESIAGATKRDYLTQIDRCIYVYNVNTLAAITTGILEFRHRFSRSAFPHEFFKTQKSYLAWRKKMISILKRVTGLLSAANQRRGRDDDWASVIDHFKRGGNLDKRGLISVSLLADEARKVGRSPSEMDREWLVRLMDDLSVGRRRAIPVAVHLLNSARRQSAFLDTILGPHPLPDPAIVSRKAPAPIPIELDQQILVLVAEHCRGEVDEISNEASGARSQATQDGHRAALRKYVGTALESGALSSNCLSLTEVFERHVFIQVMQMWIRETDTSKRISDRTKRSYVGVIMSIAAKIGKPVDFMKKAMALNPNLKNGRAEAETMPLKLSSSAPTFSK